MLGPFLVALMCHNSPSRGRRVEMCDRMQDIDLSKTEKRLATLCVHQASELFTRLIIRKALLHLLLY